MLDFSMMGKRIKQRRKELTLPKTNLQKCFKFPTITFQQ